MVGLGGRGYMVGGEAASESMPLDDVRVFGCLQSRDPVQLDAHGQPPKARRYPVTFWPRGSGRGSPGAVMTLILWRLDHEASHPLVDLTLPRYPRLSN